MSNEDRPEFRALAELERVLGHVQEELSSWRRRAHKAESDKAELGLDHDVVAARETIVELEGDIQERDLRLNSVRDRVDGLLARLKFLGEQVETEEQGR